MPDIKTGHEKKGLNKRTQLTERPYERELPVLDGDDDKSPLDAASDDADGEFLADELPEDDWRRGRHDPRPCEFLSGAAGRVNVHHRANYATVFIGSHPHSEGEMLDLDWADDAGDETETFEFDVPTDDPREPYLGIQAFDVGGHGREIRINDGPLSRFDIPPGDGWQYRVDIVTDASLVERTNTIRAVRDDERGDAFAVGAMTIYWKEPVEE